MKQQTTALLFCTLLLSTFAHDHLRARQHAPRALKHEKSHSKLLSRIQSRNQDDSCITLCPANGTADLINVVLNTTLSVIGFVNVTNNEGFIIDYVNQIAMFVNGSCGEAVLIKVAEGVGVYVKPGVSSSKTWIAEEQSFEGYVNDPTPAAEVYEAFEKNGEKFSLTSITQAVRILISGILISLDSRISVTTSQPETIAMQISLSLISSFKQLGRVIASGTFNLVVSGLIRFANRAQGILYFIGVLNLQGGIQALINAGIEFKLDLTFNQNSGVTVLTYFLGVIQTKINIESAIAAILTTPKFFQLVTHLSGETEFVVVVNAILNLLDPGNSANSTLIRQVLSVIINYVYSILDSGVDLPAVRTEWDKGVQNLITISPAAANSTFLRDLRNGSLTYNGVNVSSLLHLLLQVGSTAAIEVVVGIIVVLSAAISIKILVDLLIIQLLFYFGSTLGISVLKVIFPGIQITLQAIYQVIIKLPLIISGGTCKYLQRIPSIGQIIIVIEAAFKAVLKADGSETFDLETYLDGSSSITEVIIVIIKLIQSAAGGDEGASKNLTQSLYFEFVLIYQFNTSPIDTNNCNDRHLEHKLRDFVLPIHRKFQAKKHHAKELEKRLEKQHHNHISAEKHHAKELEKHHARQLEKQHLNHISAKHLHAKHQTHEKLHKGN